MTRVVALLIAVIAVVTEAPAAAVCRASYDDAVLADRPAAYWPMTRPYAGTESSLGTVHLTGRYAGGRGPATLPNGDTAADFDGATGYLEVADNAVLSPATTGALTLEAWLRPDTLQFPHQESSGYVHWMGKGGTGQHEFAARMYSHDNTENRPNRVSGYAFNQSGGLGAGSYFQDSLAAGTWIHYVLVINAAAKSAAFPNGYTKLYRDGVLRDQDDLSIHGQIVVPVQGSAPLRVGTRDFASFFSGAVGKVAIYDRELASADIVRHHAAMVGR
jgi:hypothetical protein